MKSSYPVHGHSQPKKTGFTLTELMVVIGILAILSAVAVPVYNSMVGKARAKDGERALAMVKASQEIYRSTRFTYTDDFSALNISGFTTEGGNEATFGDYTIVIEATTTSFSATASGYPLSEDKLDEWKIDNTMNEAEHTKSGY